MMKKIIFIVTVFFAQHINAQELFVYTEPASNMAARSIGVRLNNNFSRNADKTLYNYQLSPEIMLGVSRKLMIHADAFFSNHSKSFALNGVSVYVKYRFFSIDEVHNHFRMAAYGRCSFNSSIIHQLAIDLNGLNSGYEMGFVATQLVQKVALSANASIVHVADNSNSTFIYGDEHRNGINYTLSFGKLLLPKEYINYEQTNLNFMIEFPGQVNLYSGYTYLDIAPSVQLIINSRMRVDAGYRYPLINKLFRSSPEAVLLRLEYNFFNAY